MTEYLLMVLKAATVYAEDSSAPHGDTCIVWLKSPWSPQLSVRHLLMVLNSLKKKKKTTKPTKKKYLSNQNKTWPGSIKQRAEQIGAIVKGGQICCLSRLAVSSRKDLM